MEKIEVIAQAILNNDYSKFSNDLEWFKDEVVKLMAKGKLVDVNVLVAYNQLVAQD